MTLHSFTLHRTRRALFNSIVLSGLAALAILAGACQNDSDDKTNPAASVTVSSDDVTQPATAVSPSSTPVADPPTPTVAIATATPKPISTPEKTATAIPATPTVESSPTPTVVPLPIFIPAPQEPNIPAPPDRDLQELGKRLVPGYNEPTTVLSAEPLTLGQQVDFWVSRDVGSVFVSGEVSYISEHAYWIFEYGFIPDHDDIEEVANKFEADIWPAVTDVFGTPLMPGIDGDDRMVVYTSTLRTGVAGYFSAADSYPSEIRAHSNQREALYMSANRLKLTGSEYLSVIAHELQHATHFATDSSEDSWINEGLSEVAAEIAGFERSAARQFVRAPSTSLTAWAQDITISTANYGAANLFFAFVASHYGGNEILAAIAQNQEDGIASIDSTLKQMGFTATANEVFADWLIANYLHENDGAYSYNERSFPPVKSIYKRAPDLISGRVKSFAADYFVTSSGSSKMTVEFNGEARTSLLTSAPHSGDTCWWSNHGDSIDSTLTRNVDLRPISSGEAATLKYWVNYEIEEFWDYAYVLVSTNDGETWDILDTDRARNYDPNGNAYGPGITGRSPGWVQDSVDISEYAGEQILLRLEYITDDAVFSKGACFDDFEIPELNWNDDTSTLGDWDSQGFARVEETIPTQYLVQVIHEKNVGDPVVYQLPIDINANGKMTVEEIDEDDLIIVVVSAVTRQSTMPTEYTVDITP
jgi:immune inhibitor A